ncbi:hypothetical protein SLA2020_226020 [Shorea laevis]
MHKNIVGFVNQSSILLALLSPIGDPTMDLWSFPEDVTCVLCNTQFYESAGGGNLNSGCTDEGMKSLGHSGAVVVEEDSSLVVVVVVVAAAVEEGMNDECEKRSAQTWTIITCM